MIAQTPTQNIVLASVMIPEIVEHTEPVMAIEVLTTEPVEPQWTCEICNISVKASSKSKHIKTKKHTQKMTNHTKSKTKPVIPVKPIEYTISQQKPVVPPKPAYLTHPTVKTLDDTQREQVIRETLARYNIFVKDEEGIKELVALKRWKNLNPETYRKYIDLLFTNYPWFARIETFDVQEYDTYTLLDIIDEGFNGYNYSRHFDDCFEEVEQLAQSNPNRAQERRQILDQVLEKEGFTIRSSKEEILFFHKWKDADNPTFEKYMKRMFENTDDLPKTLDRVVINDQNELEYWYTKPNGKLKHKCEKINFVYNDMFWGE